jgi:hypothetical protein
MKSGVVKLCPVVAWDIPPSDTLSESMARDGLVADGESMTYEWVTKVQNTVIFRKYLTLARKYEDASKFYGISPVQLLDLS